MRNPIAADKAHRVPVIVGPTAVGKTAAAILLAEALGGAIVSADSRQIYRHMDIGTAKPTAAEQSRVRHHFIDICELDENYSAGAYGRAARACIDDLFTRNIQPVIAGGSGFYLRALIDGLFAPPASDPAVKQKWRERIDRDGAAAVHAELEKIDPESAVRLHFNDTQRIVRALEVWEIIGMPISHFQNGYVEPAEFIPVFIGLTRPRAALYERINRRVEQMFADGLLEEVRRLTEMGYGLQHNALRTVGYQEILQGEGVTQQEIVGRIKTHSRQYAKRQLTWFRRDSRIYWIDVEALTEEQIVQEILIYWEK